MKTSTRRLLHGIELALVILFALVFATYYNVRRVNDMEIRINQNREVLSNIRYVMYLASKAELSARDFMLTGNRRYIAQVNQTNNKIITGLIFIRTLTATNVSQKPLLDSASFHLQQGMKFSNDIISLRKKEGREAAMRLIQLSKGASYKDLANNFLSRIEVNENRVLLQAKNEWGKALALMNGSLLVSVVFVLILILKLLQRTRLEALGRRHLLTELLKSRERMEEAGRLASFGSWTLDLSTGLIDASDEMFRIWDYIPGETERTLETFISKVYPEDIALIKERFQNVNTEHSDTFIIRLRGKNDSVKYVQSGIHISREGEQFSITGFVQDITEKKLSEYRLITSKEELLKVKERLLLVNYAARIGIWDYDVQDNRMHCDEGMYVLYHFDAESRHVSSAAAWLSSIHPDDAERAGNEIKEALRGKERLETDFRIIWPDKSVRYLRTLAVIHRNDQRTAVRMVGACWDVTQQKNAEIKIEEVNRQLNLLFNRIDEVFFSRDLISGKLIQISATCERIFGYTSDEFMNNTGLWLEVIHPDDLHILEHEHARLLRSTQIVDQYRVIARDGTIRWVENKIIPTIDKNGELVRLDGVTRDITERKMALKKMGESEERYRQIVETSQEGIWTIDENNRISFFNKRVCEILEYSPEEMKGKHLFDFMDAEGRKMAEKQVENRKRKLNGNYDVKYITKSGKEVWTSISTSSLFSDKGEYKGALAMVTDITQRKVDEEALKKSEANLRTIFNNSEISYVLFNANLEIVSFNRHAELYGESRGIKKLEEGNCILEYFSPSKQTDISDILKTVKKGEPVIYEYSVKQKDGGLKWFEVRWISITSSDNKHIGFMVANSDITDNKIAVLEREKIISELIQRNKAQEQFTYIVSHNLRAPVANIMGLGRVLGMLDHNDDGRQTVIDDMVTSAKALDAIIVDLNKVLQLRYNIDEKAEEINFTQLIKEISNSFNSIIKNNNIKIECDFKEAEHFYSIRSYLNSIFYNLIQNSIKYRQEDRILFVGIKTADRGNFIEILFTDNGKGIDLEKNGASLFGLYKRFDTSVKGKGIGLFMIKAQVEALGGTIDVKSELRRGTQFSIKLPVSNI